MLDSLRFVQGAVAKKDFVPALTHFNISNGFVRGFNGKIALCSPIELNLDAQPKALPFVKALQACDDTIQLHLTAAGRLSVKSGKFKAFVECTTDPFPFVAPEGDVIPLETKILPVIQRLARFIGDDASRPWVRGILLRGQSAFATNNVVLIEHWLGTPFPIPMNIPESAISELIRIGEEPTQLQVSETSCTFHFNGARWLRTQLLTTEWPDLSRVLDRSADPQPYPKHLFEAIETLKPFLDDTGAVFLRPGQVSTSLVEDLGAVREVKELEAEAKFNAGQLLMLSDVSEKIDFSGYPGPCIFYGDKLRGAIIGMRT